MSSVEMDIMKKIEEKFLELDDAAKQRVLRYMLERFGVSNEHERRL